MKSILAMSSFTEKFPTVAIGPSWEAVLTEVFGKNISLGWNGTGDVVVSMLPQNCNYVMGKGEMV